MPLENAFRAKQIVDEVLAGSQNEDGLFRAYLTWDINAHKAIRDGKIREFALAQHVRMKLWEALCACSNSGGALQ